MLLRKNVEVVGVSCWNLLEKVGVGRGGGRWWKGSASKRGRGYRKRGGMEVREGSGGRGGGGVAGGGAEGGVEREHSLRPVNAGVVALQPGKLQHQLEVAKSSDLEGECLCVSPVVA